MPNFFCNIISKGKCSPNTIRTTPLIANTKSVILVIFGNINIEDINIPKVANVIG